MIRINDSEYRMEDAIQWILSLALRSKLLSHLRSYWQFWWFVSLLSEDFAYLDTAKSLFMLFSIAFSIRTFLLVIEELK